MVKAMREIEWNLISQLLTDSRKSDRELSKKLGVSQPTVSRLRHKLEKQGYIKQYTILPDFQKLGFAIAAITFVRYKGGLNAKQADEMRKRAEQRFKDQSFAMNVIMFERGLGFGYTGVLISLHEDYSSFTEYLQIIRQYPVLDPDFKTFLIDLKDNVHYRPLTFATLAQHILTMKRQEAP